MYKLICAATTLTLAVTTSCFAQTFTHVQGDVELSAVPEKVVAFDLAALDTLDALGVPVTGLPKPHALGYLENFKADKYTNVGTFFEPDFEITASIEPDLIIVGGRTQARLEAMSEIAPTIDITVGYENFLDQFYARTELLAEIFDKEAVAEAQLNAIKQKIAHVNEKAKTSGNALFILTSGGKISAYGQGSRFGWLHNELGFTPAVEDVETATHGDPISFEFLTKVNPDWIFVLDRDAAIGQGTGAAKALLDNDLINNLNAAVNDQIVYLDGVAWYMVAYGITSVDKAVSDILKAINK